MTPHKFLTKPAFLLLWGVYSGTYVAANLITTTADIKETSYSQRATAKFLGVSAANLSLNISKDSVFTSWFGSGVPRPLPVATYASEFHPSISLKLNILLVRNNAAKKREKKRTTPTLRRIAILRCACADFAARDSLTVFASFNLSPIAAAYMVDSDMCDEAVYVFSHSLELRVISHKDPFQQETFGRNTGDKGTAVVAAQLVCPVAMQWFSVLTYHRRPPAER